MLMVVDGGEGRAAQLSEEMSMYSEARVHGGDWSSCWQRSRGRRSSRIVMCVSWVQNANVVEASKGEESWGVRVGAGGWRGGEGS